MTFSASTYHNMVSQDSAARERLFLQYLGPRNDFDIIVVGSGIGGGILADDLADRLKDRRILLLEAGSFIYPTHVYNLCRFPNGDVARHFGAGTFWQQGNSGSQRYIGEWPQLCFGGRSIFWSGLIPTLQPWELDFFPERVRDDLAGQYLAEAGRIMNESVSMGSVAEAVVERLRNGPLKDDFDIQQTPRALHQPYLEADGTPKEEFFTEPTGVFNTAELLINEVGLTPGKNHGDGPGLHILLNSFVEDVQQHGGVFHLVTRNTLTNQLRVFSAVTVVLACGSIESPKLLRRSTLFHSLPESSKPLIGRGLTDHPTSHEVMSLVTSIDGVDIPRSSHAKIIFYSRGRRQNGEIVYPFNVEMNINHEWWHLRQNDPSAAEGVLPTDSLSGPSRMDIKFSFGNPLDEENQIHAAPPFGYVPEIAFHNQSWMDRLRDSRFPALAGWNKDFDAIFDVMNDVAAKVFEPFRRDNQAVQPSGKYGQNDLGFGWGTVHHAAGSLRMPARPSHDTGFNGHSVVDEDLRVVGTDHLYVCDMSVMPMSPAANPVRPLAGLALRLSHHFG